MSFNLNLLAFFLLTAIAPLAGQTSKNNPKLGYFIEVGGRISYYLGIHQNAKVMPGTSFSMAGGIFYPLSAKSIVGLSIGFVQDIQHISSTSLLGSVSYNRRLRFFDFSLGYERTISKNKEWSIRVAPRLRILTDGQLIRSDYHQRGANLEKEELNLEYFRTFSPGLELSPWFRLLDKPEYKFDLGLKLNFSFASTDYSAQPGTLNTIQLSLRFRLCRT